MTAPCDRYEREALLLLEEGRPLDEHFATCPECLAARAAHERLRAALLTPIDAAPRAGWEAGVLSAIDRAPARRSPWARRAPWMAGAMAAAAAVSLVVIRTRPLDDALALDAAVMPGDAAQVRGAGTHVGDLLQLHARARGRFAELRVYRNDRELVMRCAPPQSSGADFKCTRDGSALAGELRLPSVGAFQAFVAASDKELPPPASTLGEDTERLIASGAKVALGPSVRVY